VLDPGRLIMVTVGNLINLKLS